MIECEKSIYAMITNFIKYILMKAKYLRTKLKMWPIMERQS